MADEQEGKSPSPAAATGESRKGPRNDSRPRHFGGTKVAPLKNAADGEDKPLPDKPESLEKAVKVKIVAAEKWNPLRSRKNCSLFIFPSDGIIRVNVLRFLKCKWFERAIFFLIMANTLILALTDYTHMDELGEPREEGSFRNTLVEKTEAIFTICFTIECALKIIGLGLILGKDSYLRDRWNQLDLIVVVAGLLTVLPGMPNISIFRTFRLLRPLRSLSALPGLRKLVTSLLGSIPAMVNVIVLLAFIFTMFSILGMQLWAGVLHARCRMTPFPIILPPAETNETSFLELVVQSPEEYKCLDVENDDASWTKSTSPWRRSQDCYWPLSDPEDGRVCTGTLLATSGNYRCPEGTYCGSNYDALGNARFRDSQIMRSATYTETLAWGFTNFDNLFSSFLTIFQSITMEGWTDIMYQYQDAYDGAVATIFFQSLILVGAFFMLNLLLAVIWDNFSTYGDDEEDNARELGSDHAKRIDDKETTPSKLAMIVNSRAWAVVTTALILVNTSILAADHYPMDADLQETLECINLGFTFIFGVEMVIKVSALGFRRYMEDTFNIFDMFIVVISVVELITSQGGTDDGSAGGLSALRCFRLFRIFKLAKSWTSLRVLLATIVKTLRELANFIILLTLFMLIYSLIGMQLFANKLRFDPATGTPLSYGDDGWNDADVPRANFDTLIWSSTTVFQVLSGENWNVIMYDARRAVGWPSTLYFLSLMVIGNFVLMNLFLAILLGNFEGMEELNNPQRKESNSDFRIAPLPGSSMTRRLSSAAEKKMADKMRHKMEEDASIQNCTEGGSSLYIFVADNKLRACLRQVVEHRLFDDTVLVLIMASSVTLAVDNPLYDPTSTTVVIVNWFNTIFTVLFFVEMVMKVIVHGLIIGPKAYLRDGWNILDFSIVIVSVVGIIALDGLQVLKSLRTLRALRPLRMINRQPGMKLVVNTLIRSIPSIINVGFVCILFLLIFAITGVNYLKGTFFSCQGAVYESLGVAAMHLITYPNPWSDLSLEQQNLLNGTGCAESYRAASKLTSRFVCECFGAEWGKSIPQSFDDVPSAIGCLFELSTTEGWVDVMYAAVDSRGIDMQPVENSNLAWVLFFVLYIIVGAFFVMNLFVGVVIDNFNRIKDESGGNALLTPEQREWIQTQKTALNLKPMRKRSKPLGAFRRKVSALVRHPRFDKFIMICIIFNMALLSTNYFGSGELLDIVVEIGNILFTFLFTIEMVLKITDMGFRGYVGNRWNQFDGFIVVGSNLALLMLLVVDADVMSPIIKTFRIIRIFRVINAAKSLRKLFATLVLTLPSLGNIGGLLGLLAFMYAAMGVQLFAKVGNYGSVDDHANFRDFWTAISFLFRACTGESWNSVMHSLAMQPSGCDVDPYYDSHVCGFTTDLDPCPSSTERNLTLAEEMNCCLPLNGCGNRAAYAYFISFTLAVTFVMVNLFIAVILEGFSNSADDKDVSLSSEQFRQLRETWAEFDPSASGYLTLEDFVPLMRTLPRPIGLGTMKEGSIMQIVDHLGSYDVPITSSAKGEYVVEFQQVAQVLAQKAMEENFKLRGLHCDQIREISSSTTLTLASVNLLLLNKVKSPPKTQEIPSQHENATQHVLSIKKYLAAILLQRFYLEYKAKKLYQDKGQQLIAGNSIQKEDSSSEKVEKKAEPRMSCEQSNGRDNKPSVAQDANASMTEDGAGQHVCCEHQ